MGPVFLRHDVWMSGFGLLKREFEKVAAVNKFCWFLMVKRFAAHFEGFMSEHKLSVFKKLILPVFIFLITENTTKYIKMLYLLKFTHFVYYTHSKKIFKKTMLVSVFVILKFSMTPRYFKIP